MFYAYNAIVTLLTLAVLIAYVNHRFTKLQPTIAIMMAALGLSALMILMEKAQIISIATQSKAWIASIDFHALVIDGLLSYLLFAGALHIDVSAFRQNKWQIGTLSCVSTILSTVCIAFSIQALAALLGQPLPISLCLLFGSLISPTDPIAVLSLLKQMKAPKHIQAKMAGESLFNDGVGIVLFSSLYTLHYQHSELNLWNVSSLFAQEAFGGILYGLLLGKMADFLIRRADDPKLTIMITLIITSAGYALAQQFFLVSGPLAMVVAGMYLSSLKDKSVYRPVVVSTLNFFWELVDELLNAILFLLLGLELLILDFNMPRISLMLLTIPLVLFIRFITVALPMSFFREVRKRRFQSLPLLVWGGLRGGLAVALVMSLPDGPQRGLLLALTYAVVLFSILIQGSTVKYLIQRFKA
jgi:monovalent cation:H+ antiporter, CPA1 family